MIDSAASRILALRADRLSHHVPRISIRSLPAHSGIRPAQYAALGAGAKLVVLVLEQDVGCMISDLYLGTSRRTRPLPRGVAGHVAHPIRSIQISDF